MQGSFINRFLIRTSAIALVLMWTGVPLAQAQPREPQEECDLAPAPSGAPSPTQCADLPEECALAPVPADLFFQSQPPELPGLDVPKVRPNPPICQSGPGEESRNIKREHSSDSAPARNHKELVMRKPCHEMDDREMDGMCGGLTGSFDITGNGNMTMNDNSTQSLSLSGQAQQNLNSLVNITSINSTISVLLNLNVNINSTVGTVNQGNTGTQNTGVQNTVTQISHP